MSDNEVVIKVENLSLRGVGNLYEPEAKRYRLGLIGGKTLRDDVQRWWAKFRGKPDPMNPESSTFEVWTI